MLFKIFSKNSKKIISVNITVIQNILIFLPEIQIYLEKNFLKIGVDKNYF